MRIEILTTCTQLQIVQWSYVPSKPHLQLKKIKAKSSTTTNVIDILACTGKVTQSQVRPDR